MRREGFGFLFAKNAERPWDERRGQPASGAAWEAAAHSVQMALATRPGTGAQAQPAASAPPMPGD